MPSDPNTPARPSADAKATPPSPATPSAPADPAVLRKIEDAAAKSPIATAAPMSECEACKSVHDATSDYKAHERIGVQPVAAAPTPAPGSAKEAKLDLVTQEVMSKVSPEGRGANRHLRRGEKWALAAVVIVIIGTAITLALRLGGIGYLVVIGLEILILLGAMWPIWTAALLRGQEEKKAKAESLNTLDRRAVH